MDIKEILNSNNFKFKKALGQNFLTDNSLLNAIVKDAGIKDTDTVMEVGAGAGTLTAVLCQNAKNVISFEVDSALTPTLNKTLGGFDNVNLIFKDILKMSDDEVSALSLGDFKVVANLPYYITTPLIMRFVESKLPVKSLTVTVQKEVAERLVAKSDTPEFGAITLQVKLRGKAEITRHINRRAFYPSPNVDSSVVKIDFSAKPELDEKTQKLVSKLIKAAFQMRRKTLVNNLSNGFNKSKDEIKDILKGLNYNENIRGEALDLDDYIKIAYSFALDSSL